MLAETTLLTKVALLLACCMMIGAGGTYFGRNVRSLGAFIGLAILFIAGTIGVYFAAAVSPAVGVGVLFLWTFISGLFIGPAVQSYAERLGWQTVCLAYAGTSGVMAVTGGIPASHKLLCGTCAAGFCCTCLKQFLEWQECNDLVYKMTDFFVLRYLIASLGIFLSLTMVLIWFKSQM